MPLPSDGAASVEAGGAVDNKFGTWLVWAEAGCKAAAQAQRPKAARMILFFMGVLMVFFYGVNGPGE
jgi:hypothetical protein